MSNTGQIKRYEVYGDSVKDRYLNDDGEFVKYDDHLNIVNDLEMRVANQLKLIESANDRVSILEGDVKYMTQECEKANNRKYDDYSTLRQLDELVNYRHIILTAKKQLMEQGE